MSKASSFSVVAQAERIKRVTAKIPNNLIRFLIIVVF
jgi:hypothetical protein